MADANMLERSSRQLGTSSLGTTGNFPLLLTIEREWRKGGQLSLAASTL